MPVFQFERDGGVFEVEALDPQSALNAFMGGQSQPDPMEQEAQKLADHIESVRGQSGAGDLYQDSFTFGLGDKVGGLVGGVGSLVKGEGFGKGYNVAQRAEEIVLERARQRAGGAGTTAEIGGALSGGALAKAPAALSWLGRAGQAAKEGLTAGALQGIGQAGGSPMEMLEGGLKGGAIGGSFGPALSAGADLARAGYRGFRGLGNSLGRLNDAPQDRAVRLINESLQSDDMTPNQVAARMRRAQADPNAPPLTLMDVADENTRGLARAASINPGPGRRITNRFLEQRARGGHGRALGAAADVLGDPNAFRQTAQNMIRQRAQHGDALYGAAYQNARPVDVMRILHRLEGRLPSAKGGIQSTLQRIRGLLVRRGTMGEMPEADLRSLHEVKMELDNMLSSRGEDSMGRVSRAEIARVRRELLDAMDIANPMYAAARSVYADESSQLNALDLGRRIFREEVDELPDVIAAMGAAERRMFRMGAVREIRHLIETAPDGADAVKRIFGSTAKRAALRAAFPDDRSFRNFSRSMMREARARATRDDVGLRRGSRTAAVQAEQGAASATAEVAEDVAGAFITGGASLPNSAVKGLARLIRSRSTVTPEVAEAIANIMVLENPDQVRRMLQAGPRARTPLPTSALGTALRRGAPVGGAGAGSLMMNGR